MKRSADIFLVVTVVLQVGWTILTFARKDHAIAWIPLLTAAAFAALVLPRTTWLAGILRIAVGTDFGLAVCDRFGILGPHGSPNVGWGDWAHFVAYTHQVNAFLPASFAPSLAVMATICEIVLTVTLILGFRPSISAAGAALLLLAYAVAMTASLGFASQFPYAVLVLCAGSWLLSNRDASFLSIERFRVRRTDR